MAAVGDDAAQPGLGDAKSERSNPPHRNGSLLNKILLFEKIGDSRRDRPVERDGPQPTQPSRKVRDGRALFESGISIASGEQDESSPVDEGDGNVSSVVGSI